MTQIDSRYGDVPEDHIVGKAWFPLLYSINMSPVFNKIRWNRFLKRIE